ncbi:hypothetical protein ABFS83_07G076700 [Erythranthe nasuta]
MLIYTYNLHPHSQTHPTYFIYRLFLFLDFSQTSAPRHLFTLHCSRPLLLSAPLIVQSLCGGKKPKQRMWSFSFSNRALIKIFCDLETEIKTPLVMTYRRFI